MINEEKTLAEFGYTSDFLSSKSEKYVCVVCDICGREEVEKFNRYSDVCSSCIRIGKIVIKYNLLKK